MKYIISLIFLFVLSLAEGKSIQCDFEEVYKNGEIQQGKIFYKNNLLRYQYQDKQLFTIIYNQEYFVVRNDNKSIINKIQKDDILDELTAIISSYPNLNNLYTRNNMELNIETSSNHDFIKRIIIKSEKANLSIYFFNCKSEKLSDIYFEPFALNKNS